MPEPIDTFLQFARAGLPQSLERLFAFLRIPSVSASAAHAQDCRNAAQWLRTELQSLGFFCELLETPGHPAVFAKAPAPAGRPHVLFYGHYDVQPVDPVGAWSNPPFAPVLAGAAGAMRIHARGASDDKGQLMTFVEACRAIREAGNGYPVGITLLIEGEEETGSPHLALLLQAHRERLTADLALICDTEMRDAATPAITAALRGLLAEEVLVSCANRDLHSGQYGNAARNPLKLLVSILGEIQDGEGRIALPGFYEAVRPLSPADRATRTRFGYSDEELLGPVGLSIPAGETGFLAFEQVWSRPSFEINGIVGGYCGDGFKTVLPAKASAKISFRLVPGQDVQIVRESFRAFVRARIPADCRVDFVGHSGSPACLVPMDHPAMQACMEALRQQWNTEVAIVASGGSIPVVGHLKQVLGLDSILIGFSLPEDQVHAPNESYSISSFEGGISSWIRVLHSLADAS